MLKLILTGNIRTYERDMKPIWEKYADNGDFYGLLSDLDELFVDQELYYQLEDEDRVSPLAMIKARDIKLVCYQWFKPG